MTNPFWAVLSYVARRFAPTRPQPTPPEPQPGVDPQPPDHVHLSEESFLMAAVHRMLEARERDLRRRRLVAEAEAMMEQFADSKLRSARHRLEIDGKTVEYSPGPDFDIMQCETAGPWVNRFKPKRIMPIKMNSTSPV